MRRRLDIALLPAHATLHPTVPARDRLHAHLDQAQHLGEMLLEMVAALRREVDALHPPREWTHTPPDVQAAVDVLLVRGAKRGRRSVSVVLAIALQSLTLLELLA